MQEKLQNVKEKPQHVRENIAIGISGGITLLVFLGWGASLANSHTFAITPPTNISPDVKEQLAKASEAKNSISDLLGAAGSANTAGKTGTSAPEIKVVDSPTQKKDPTAGQTVIHF